MHLLLPPSEGKRVPSRGRPVDLDRMSWPTLRPQREQVLAALAEASTQPDALSVLGVGASLTADVERNAHLAAVPSAAAETVFTGVLYDAFGLAALGSTERSRARRWCIVMTAAYGPVRLGDRIAPYRLAMGTSLPGIGPVSGVWRAAAAGLLDDETAGGLLVDLRSADYVAAWRPADPSRWVAVRVPGASHGAKHTRGLVARALVEEGRKATGPARLVDLLSPGFDVTLHEPASARAPWTLDVGAR